MERHLGGCISNYFLSSMSGWHLIYCFLCTKHLLIHPLTMTHYIECLLLYVLTRLPSLHAQEALKYIWSNIKCALNTHLQQMLDRLCTPKIWCLMANAKQSVCLRSGPFPRSRSPYGVKKATIKHFLSTDPKLYLSIFS